MATAQRKKLLIIGFGMAASRLLDELQQQAPGCFEVTVIGEESQPAYNRILLSPLLAGEIDAAELAMKQPSWYAEQQINVHTGDPVVELKLEQEVAVTASGKCFEWDHLVIATGSRAATLSFLPGHDLHGILSLRTMRDADAILLRAQQVLESGPEAGASAVVVGGGVLGLEAACALQARGVQTTVVHNAGWPMNRQLDNEAGERLAENIRSKGIRFINNAQCERFESDESGSHVTGLRMADGEVLPCQFAVMAVGIKPEITLAQQAGLRIDRAIVVDRWLRSSVDSVFAIGECCQIDQELFGLVEPVYQHARVLAGVLALLAKTTSSETDLRAVQAYKRVPLPTRLKVSSVHVFSAGTFATDEPGDAESLDSLAWRDQQAGGYRRLWWQGDKLVGAVMFGDVDDSHCYVNLIEKQQPVNTPAQALLDPAGMVA